MKKILLILSLLCSSIFFIITGFSTTALSKCRNPTLINNSTNEVSNKLNIAQEGGVVLYTRERCSYCTYAKQLLDQQKIKYTIVSLDNDPTTVNELVAKTNHRSFPFIFVNKKFIGGYAELKKMIDNNEI